MIFFLIRNFIEWRLRNIDIASLDDWSIVTEKESNIIKYLSDHRNKIIKREDMLLELWGENDYFLGRSLDVFITKIRKYLKEDPNLTIENIFGVGFIFNVVEK